MLSEAICSQHHLTTALIFYGQSKVDLIKRSEAKKSGLTKYYTGKECKHGHISKRFTGSGSCCKCKEISSRAECKKKYDRERYQRNRHAVMERSARWYYSNREAATHASRKWTKNNPDKVKAIKQAYKARRKKWESGGMTSKELGEWLKKQSKICYWCGADCSSGYHADHYHPLSRGGIHEIENIVISCPTCNMRKKAKDPYEWAQDVGRLF